MSFNPIPVAGVELENCDGLKVSEKGRADQCAQLEQTSYELGQTKRNLTSLEKKYQATETLLTEQTAVDKENSHKMDTIKRRMADYASQITDLKSEKEDDLKQQKELRNKIKTLEDAVEEYEHEKEITERRSQEMSRQISKLQEQMETAKSNISDLNTAVDSANTKSDKSYKDLILAMEKHAAALAEKDDEIETVKKTCRGTIYLLKGQIENSDMEAAKMNMVNKDLGQEIILLQGDLDEAEATIRELNNEIPRQQDILEQLNLSLQDTTSRVEALQEALVRADLKSTQLADRNEELEEQLKQSEMNTKLTEQDNIDLHNKVTEQQAKAQSLLDTLAKVEARLDQQSESFEALEAEKSEWEVEKRKIKEIVSGLETDNQLLEETKMSLENSEIKLKNRIRDIMTEQDDFVNSLKNNYRIKIRGLEAKVSELEGLLEEETEKRAETEKAVKRLERCMKELELQGEETNHSLERQVEQITSLTGRNKQLKSQFADSEARVTALQARLRKVTCEVEESENRNATMSKMLSTPAASRCSTPSIRQSVSGSRTMIRNSVLGSRSSSRLISPEVEQIILSGRNSPIGPLSILSGRSSPNPQSPLIPFDSPNGVFDFDPTPPGVEMVTSQPGDGGVSQEINGKITPATVLEGVPEDEEVVSCDEDTKSRDEDTKSRDEDTKSRDEDTKSSDVVTKSSEVVTKSSDVVTKSSEEDTKSRDEDTKSSEEDTKSRDVVTKSEEQSDKHRFNDIVTIDEMEEDDIFEEPLPNHGADSNGKGG